MNRSDQEKHVKKWDAAVKSYDRFNAGLERRYGRYKRELFAKSRGKVLLVAAGTGLDFRFFPQGLDITAIDFSPKMVEKAKQKAADYKGDIKVLEADVQALEFPDESFDTTATSCTFCSVPDPVQGLKEIRRVLRVEGQLLMFEHVRPGHFFLGTMMDLITPLARIFGPELNRRTGDNVRKAGFRITREFNIYLDMVKLFEAVKG
jgi:ubiquinone/menaquinone biosynthesis C-methylase UbiE